GAVLNAAVSRYHGKGSDEQTLLRSMQETLDSGDILIGDALFPTFFFMAAMQSQGVDILMEQMGARKRVTDFCRGQKIGPHDHLIVIKKPKIKPDWISEADFQAAPATIQIRELKAGGKVMVTTMLCAKKAPKAELKKLYKQRWSVELDIRHIKETMGMNILSCKTPDMALKEIWVYLLAYNLIRLMMVQAAFITDIVPREISFKHSLQLWLIWSQKVDTWNDEQLYALCYLMAQQRVANRPGRIEPRAVKRRPKPYPLLMMTRALAREKVRQFGHPKKLK
ncbi:MAG: transposase, partial [gamma proteobacterium symbiont of Bathyaustriella thionipta]|nr:transposase [gamma proteobacterium symbiont of Bathyaustriella thionipta]